MEKVTKVFLSADIFLYKLNKHIENLFPDTGHSLASKSTCGKMVRQLRGDELQRIRNVHYKQIFLFLDESTLSGVQYLNIVVESLETRRISYLYDCKPLPYALNNDSIA